MLNCKEIIRHIVIKTRISSELRWEGAREERYLQVRAKYSDFILMNANKNIQVIYFIRTSNSVFVPTIV